MDDADVPILRDVLGRTRDMLSIEHVTVVANLHWEKMQALLQALCDQMQAQAQELQRQALRLSKVEEQDELLAALQQELALCKNALKEFQEDRDKNRQKELEREEAEKSRLLGYLKLLEDQESRTKNLENQFGLLRDELNASNQAVKDLGQRVSAVEEKLSLLPQRMDALEGNMKKLNATTENLQQSFLAVDFGRIARLPSMISKQEDGQAEQLVRLVSGDGQSGNVENLNAKFSSHDDHLQDLEAQIEELRFMIEQLNKAHALDLEALRKSIQALHEEPSFGPPEGAIADVPEGSLEAVVADLRRRLSRKADQDTVTQVANDVQLLKDSMKQMGNSMLNIRRRGSTAPGDPSLEIRLKKAEDDLITLGASKADRSALDALELKVSLMGSGEIDTSALQGFTDLLSKKADRSELLELRMLLQALQSSKESIQQLFEDLEEIRNVLASRKADSGSGDVLKSTLDDLARRLSEHSETLLHLEALLGTKADQSLFEALRDLVETLKQSRKTRRFSVAPAEPVKQEQPTILHEMLAEVTETLKDHERVLHQLAQGVLIMSGHDSSLQEEYEEEEINTGIVSAFQPELPVDDSISEASDLSRPATALSRGDSSASTYMDPEFQPDSMDPSGDERGQVFERQRTESDVVGYVQPEPVPSSNTAHVLPVSQPQAADITADVSPYSESKEIRHAARKESIQFVDMQPQAIKEAVPEKNEVAAKSQTAEPVRTAEVTVLVQDVTSSGGAADSRDLPQAAEIKNLTESREAPVVAVMASAAESKDDVNVHVSESKQNGSARAPEAPTPARVPDVPGESKQTAPPAGTLEAPESSQNTSTAAPRSPEVTDSKQSAPARGAEVPQSKQTAPISRSSDAESKQNTQRGSEVPQSRQSTRAPEVSEGRRNSDVPQSRHATRTPEVPESRRDVPQSRPTTRALEVSESRRSSDVPQSRQTTRTPEVPESRRSSDVSQSRQARAPEVLESRQNPPPRVPEPPISPARATETPQSKQTALSSRALEAPQSRPTPLARPPDVPESRQTAPVHVPHAPTPDSGEARQQYYAEARESVQAGRHVELQIPQSRSRDSSPSTARADYIRTHSSPQITPWRASVPHADISRGPTLFDSSYAALEDALKEKKIRAKENVKVKDLEVLRDGVDEIRALLESLQLLKADKQALEELWQFVKANLTDNAMFTGKPLLGFKCMSCEHSLEKLNPFRSDYLPTNAMPKQWLSMLTAERLFATEKPAQNARGQSPPRATPAPRVNEQSTAPAAATTAPAGNRTDSNQIANVKTPTTVQLGPKVASIGMRSSK